MAKIVKFVSATILVGALAWVWLDWVSDSDRRAFAVIDCMRTVARRDMSHEQIVLACERRWHEFAR